MTIRHWTTVCALVAITALTGCFGGPDDGDQTQAEPTASTPRQAAAKPTSPTAGARVVATFNGNPITMTMLDHYWAPMRLSLEGRYKGEIPPDVVKEQRERFLDRLLDDMAQLDIAQKYDVTIDDAFIGRKLEALRARQGSGNTFFEQMDAMGYSMEDIEEKVKRERIISKLKQQRLPELVSDDDPALQTYYRENPHRFRSREAITVRQIFLRKDPMNPEMDPDAIGTRAREIHEQATSGEDFSELAATYSEHQTARNGGLMAPIYRGRPGIEDAVYQAAKALNKTGDISPVIETDRGFYILRLETKVDERVRPFEQVKGQILAQLRQQRYEEWVKELRENANVEVNLE